MTKSERNKEYYAKNREKIRKQQYEYYYSRWKPINAGVKIPENRKAS